ncbi:MAG: hypothetical protein MUC62_03695 [Candidatus Thermoplasmatota archaeon]|jgi:hypothetical protein|nr:hypothetical protein [Candidatus Thermoplasmatota archaeon]
MKHDYDWLRTGSEDLLALVREKGEGDLHDPQTGARYPRKYLMDIYGYLVRKCVEEPWDENLYGILKMVASILDIPEDAQRKLHTEAMLNPFMIARDQIDTAMVRELEKAFHETVRPISPSTYEGPRYGLNLSSETGSLESLQTSSSVLLEVERDSIIADMLSDDLGPSSSESTFSLDTQDRKRPEVMVKPPSTKPQVNPGPDLSA